MNTITSSILKTVAAAAAMTAAVAVADVRLQGAGATFPAPFYKRLVAEYQKLNPDVAIDYQSIGSGGGIKAFSEKTVDFGASDAPLNRKEMTGVGGKAAIIEIPSCAGGVVPTYNLPGVKTDLKFTGTLLADIYLGKVTKWNDPAIAKLNPGVDLPDMTITPAWRTDGSGTTFVWTNYLCTQSEDFKGTVGLGKAVRWPVGQGGKGNEGVTAVVQQTVGGLGYVEQSYADHNHIPYGAVQNKNGKFVKASPASVSAAGGGAAAQLKGNILAANIWNQPGDDAYPIASFTYLLVYKDMHNLSSTGRGPGPGRFPLVGDARRAEVRLRSGLRPPGRRRAGEERSRPENAELQGKSPEHRPVTAGINRFA